MMGVAASLGNTDWEQLSEDYSFVFYSCDLQGRIHYVNQAWQDVVEHDNAPEFLAYCAPNQNLYDAFDRTGARRFLRPFELIRRGSVSHFEEIVPCHVPNQYRWMLLRMHRLGEEVVCSSYFLRYYEEEAPRDPKIHCLTDGGSWRNHWAYDSTPVDEETSIALCPNCALQFYSYLRQ